MKIVIHKQYNNSMIKEVSFNSGIQRVNSGIYCNEGACDEIINFRREGNVWKTIGEKELFEDIKGIIRNSHNILNSTIHDVYIHSASKNDGIIIHRTYLNKNIMFVPLYRQDMPLFYRNSEGYCIEEFAVSLLRIGDNEEFLSISSLNNVLIVCTSLRKVYFVYKDGQYINVNMNLNNNGVLFADVYQDLYSNSSYKQHVYEVNPLEIYSPSLMIKNAYTHFLNIAKQYKLYSGLSFFRYAIKLYDGTYLYFSNIDFADTNGDTSNKMGSNINNLIFMLSANKETETSINYKKATFYNNAGCHRVKINFADINMIKTLFELRIIVSIDIFMTRPLLQIDLDCKNEDYKLVHSYPVQSGGYNLVQYFKLPINKNKIINELTNGIFYKVKSFDLADVRAVQGSELNYDVFYDDIEKLTSNETMPTDNGRDSILFKNAYTYNQKQHIFDLIYDIFNGYSFPRNIEIDNATENNFSSLKNALFPSNSNNDVAVYAVVKGIYNEEDFCVRVNIENPYKYFFYNYSFFNLSTIKFYMPRLFTYPTLENFDITIYIEDVDTNETKLIYSTTSSEASFINNFSIIASLYPYNNQNTYFNSKNYPNSGVYPTTENAEIYPESNLKPVIITKLVNQIGSYEYKEKAKLSFSNLLRLSETENPFIFPAINSYSFGEKDTNILAAEATVGQMTETKFGMFPLYVFTDIGVYAMGVGAGNIAYQNITPVNNHIIKNKRTLNVGNSILYLSDNGLNVISGRETKLLSELVKGVPESINAIYSGENISSNIAEHFGFVLGDFSTTDFLEEIKNAEFVYDNVHEEVLFVCNSYSYIYSLMYNVFYKSTDVFNGVYNTNNKSILNKVVDKYIYFYDVSKEAKKERRSIFISKPFNLGTRQLKKVQRFILSMSVDAVSGENTRVIPNCDIWVLGSNDMISYTPYKEMSIASEKDLQDVFMTRFFKSFKYAILIIATKQSECLLSGGVFEFEEKENKMGIR